MIDIRQPNITAQTEKEQLLQMRSYLYQLSQQLQWAFSTIETSSGASESAPNAANQAGGSTSKENEKVFSGIKDLIIKSSEIVSAFYSQINHRLEGLYVAQSDFGTYTEKTALDLTAFSNSISQLYTNTRTISGTVDEMYSQMVSTNAYIKTGLLYDDKSGNPVYGLEIGQTNDSNGQQVFDKFARFTADRLSFFDSNDIEVAYISDYKLYITNAEISGSLTVTGRFKIYFNHGLAFQWIGGSS